MNQTIEDRITDRGMLMAGMMLLVSIELAKPMLKLRRWRLGLTLFTAILSVITNMAIGFAIGLALVHLLKALRR